MDGKLAVLVITTGKSCLQPCFPNGKIELSERYIKKLNCGHTLQSHNAVVLYRNNGIRTSSVTAAIYSSFWDIRHYTQVVVAKFIYCWLYTNIQKIEYLQQIWYIGRKDSHRRTN